MPIYPRGNHFLVSVGSGKERVRKSAKTEEEAQALEASLLAGQAAQRLAVLQAAQRGDKTKTLQDCYDRAYKDRWAGSKGERTTVLNAKQILALLGPETPVTAIDAMSIDAVVDELEDDGNTGATVNKKLATLSVMLNMAMDRGWLKYRPHVRRRKENSQRLYYYEHAEEAEMVSACRHLGLTDLADFIPFAIDTGFRRSELLRLELADYNPESDDIKLHRGQTKSGEGRTVPCTDTVRRILEKAQKAGHKRVFQGLTEATLRGQWYAMRDYLGKTEDPKYIVHVLRHTCATRLAIGGATGAEIMAWMGHSAIQTSMRYVHLASKHLHHLRGVLDIRATKPALRVVNGGA